MRMRGIERGRQRRRERGEERTENKEREKGFDGKNIIDLGLTLPSIIII